MSFSVLPYARLKCDLALYTIHYTGETRDQRLISRLFTCSSWKSETVLIAYKLFVKYSLIL